MSSIRRAIEEAETIVNVPVESALIGVAGVHVRGLNSRGGITVGARPRDIQRDDVRTAIEAARSVSLPEDREVLHVLPQEFFLDRQDNIRDAIGMVGVRLEANVHIVTASGSSTQNIVTAVNRAGVRVDDTVLEPLAVGRSVPHAGRARTRLLPARYRRRDNRSDRVTRLELCGTQHRFLLAGIM